MDKTEASIILDEHLAQFTRRGYRELAALVDSPQAMRATGASGAAYQIEFNIFYDSEPNGDLRIMALIDDGGLRSLAPLTRSEIMKPNGELA
jgi:hypothetical protein